MLEREKYPILEFDPAEGIIDPRNLAKKYGTLPGERLVITFFKEQILRYLEEGKISHYMTIGGENEIPVYKFADSDTFLLHGMIGSPGTAGQIEDLWGIGIRKIMFCGGGGVLDKNIGVGELLVVEGSIRDEGCSYHYAPPSRVVYSQEDVREMICGYLSDCGIPHLRGLTWTTDGFYRETREKIARRREEGAKVVEMEQAGAIAVTAFRGIKYGSIIYGGDDVSGAEWDKRGWNEKKGIRYALIGICKELVEKM